MLGRDDNSEYWSSLPLEASHESENVPLADAAAHQFDIDHLMIVDVEIDLIAERADVPFVRCTVLGLKDQAGDIEARERLNEGLPTAGLVVIDFAAETWDKLHAHAGRLERFVTPRSLGEW